MKFIVKTKTYQNNTYQNSNITNNEVTTLYTKYNITPLPYFISKNL